MKETIYTIPIMDAFMAHDECPFCFIERQLTEHAISFTLGSSYMEDDFRAQTDKIGFCRLHYKMLFDYGNRLGAALILSTHLHQLNAELETQIKTFSPAKSSLLKRMKKIDSSTLNFQTTIGSWAHEKETSCYVCAHIKDNYNRYLDTFFEMWNCNPQFVQMVKDSKGFCLHHFSDLIETAELKLNDKQKAEFYPTLFTLMKNSLSRLEAEVTWFTEKYDYRNKEKGWGTSKDSVQRSMQKVAGGYPADPPFQADR